MTMALADDEQRRLADIERDLAKDDPRLARRLAERKPVTAGLVANAVMLLGIGLVIIVVGAGQGKPLVIAIGVIMAVIVPILAWFAA
jgi:Flp pilus assembly protein TadB